MSQAGRLAVGELRDKVLVGKAKVRVGFPQPREFSERGLPAFEMLREKGANTAVKPSKLCW